MLSRVCEIVGGDEHSFCSLSLKSTRQEMISSHIEILKMTIEDKRHQVKSWNADICHIDRFQYFVHDVLMLIEIADLF